MFRIFFGLALSALLTVSAHAQQPAASRLDDIIKRGSLRVGMIGDYRPFTYLDKTTSKFQGFSRTAATRRSTQHGSIDLRQIAPVLAAN